MNIIAERFKIEMSHEQLWKTAFDVRNVLLKSLVSLWIDDQDNWRNHEAERLDRIKNMFYALGRPDLYNEIDDLAKKTFEDFNKNKP